MGILGQVWCLIISILDLSALSNMYKWCFLEKRELNTNKKIYESEYDVLSICIKHFGVDNLICHSLRFKDE